MKLWTLLTAKQFEAFDRGEGIQFNKPSHIFKETQHWLFSTMGLQSWPAITFFKTPSPEMVQDFILYEPISVGIHKESEDIKKYSSSLFPSNDDFFDEKTSCTIALNAMKPHKGVILELNVPNNEKMLFFYEKAWTHICNYRFLGTDVEVAEFNKRCKQKGFSHQDLQPHHHEGLHLEILESWKRIFDLKWCDTHMSKISQKKQYEGLSDKMARPFKNEEQFVVLLKELNPVWMEGCYYINQNLLDSLGIGHEFQPSESNKQKMAI